MQRKYLHISLAVVLIFVAVVLYYIVSPVYLGAFPIGIITGVCILVQMATLFLSVKNMETKGYQLKTLVSIGIEGLSIIGMGYFFIVWWMII